MGAPASLCMTLTRPDFILVPIPAASTMEAIFAISGLSLSFADALLGTFIFSNTAAGSQGDFTRGQVTVVTLFTFTCPVVPVIFHPGGLMAIPEDIARLEQDLRELIIKYEQ